jgi:hypothetical protein
LIDSLVLGNNKQHRLVQTLILVERRGDRIKTKETGLGASHFCSPPLEIGVRSQESGVRRKEEEGKRKEPEEVFLQI